MKLEYEVEGLSTSSLQFKNYNHGKAGTSLFGNVRPVGPRTPTKKIPRCFKKPSFNWKVVEQLADIVDIAATSVVHKKSSKYRGVTKHKVTHRYEAHLWDKFAYNNKQKKKGRQVYLGAYDEEIAAAQAYDLAALKYWGPSTLLNFKLEYYTKQLKEMEKLSKEEYLATLRRKSSGFSRGVSKYRGVARHHHNGRWEARIGRVEGNKYLYLGTFGTQEEAAEAYDRAAIHYRKAAAVTNFELSRYPDLFPNIPAKNGPKNKIITKNHLKDNRIANTVGGGGSSPAMQMLEDVKQTIDGGRNSAVPENLFDGGMKPTNPEDSSRLLSDCEKNLPVLEIPKQFTYLNEETSGLNNLVTEVKQEGFPSLPDSASQPDYFMGLGTEYDEFPDELLAGFNVLNDMSYTQFEKI